MDRSIRRTWERKAASFRSGKRRSLSPPIRNNTGQYQSSQLHMNIMKFLSGITLGEIERWRFPLWAAAMRALGRRADPCRIHKKAVKQGRRLSWLSPGRRVAALFRQSASPVPYFFAEFSLLAASNWSIACWKAANGWEPRITFKSFTLSPSLVPNSRVGVPVIPSF